MSPFAGPWTPPNPRHMPPEETWDPDTAHRSVSDRLSWPGESAGHTTPRPRRRFHFQRFVQKEWASVMFWVLSALALTVAADRMVASEILAAILPLVIPNHAAAGGLYISNGLVLLAIENYSGSCPNLICRICEFQMGRDHRRGMLFALVVHSIGAFALVTLLKRSLPQETLTRVLGLGEPSSDCKMCDYVRWFLTETLVSCLFPVVYFVVPTLLRLNKLPMWILFLLLYPLYMISVDGHGRGSLLSPAVTSAASVMLGWGWWRVAAQCLGGFLGGRIMRLYFPDDPKV